MTSIDSRHETGPEGTAAVDDRMSDEAVRGRTGRSWAEWFALLDAAGAASLTHKEIVALLAVQEGIGPWWQQMVTVTYEKERGLRARHQKADGYQISRSRTIAAPVGTIYAALADEQKLSTWTRERGLEMRKMTPSKTIRFAFPDGSPVEIRLVAKDDASTAVTVQHSKLRDADEAERMKEVWGERLDELKAIVGG